jgi:hypothetical protein
MAVEIEVAGRAVHLDARCPLSRAAREEAIPIERRSRWRVPGVRLPDG